MNQQEDKTRIEEIIKELNFENWTKEALIRELNTRCMFLYSFIKWRIK